MSAAAREATATAVAPARQLYLPDFCRARAVLALGDSSYGDTYCGGGEQMRERTERMRQRRRSGRYS